MTDPVLEDVPVKHLAIVREDMVAQTSVAVGALEMIEDYQLTQQDDFEFAAELLAGVLNNRTLVENERGKATRGLLDTLNVIRGWFKPSIGYWDACEAALKIKMAAYVQAQRQRQQAALAAAGAASLRGEAEQAAEALQAAREAAVHKAPGALIKTVLCYEVVDASLVPREFLCVYTVAVEVYIGVHGVGAQIPGVRVYQETKIHGQAVRSK